MLLSSNHKSGALSLAFRNSSLRTIRLPSAMENHSAAVGGRRTGVAGIVSPFCFGYLVDRTGSWVFPFSVSIGLLLIGAVLACRLRPDQPFSDEQQRGTAV